jgi:dTDP-4-amino-4,6-dideoxygalactose transaminase
MSNEKFIPLSVPNMAGNEWKYVKDCLDTGWISSVGAYVTQFENMVAAFAGAKFGVAAVNGTSALHISFSKWCKAK